MGIRLLRDRLLALGALIAFSPLYLIAAVGIRLSSHGPILYRGLRAGKSGRTFAMYKFRTMHIHPVAHSSRISAHQDPRVFPFGRVLRALKIDELPQLANILRGEMAIVGPRPEDPDIVKAHYTPLGWETLRALPGLASPGSIYSYTHGERLIGVQDPERDYLKRVLPVKLALDAVYVRNASMVYDARIIARTLAAIVQTACGRTVFPDPPEMTLARELLATDQQTEPVSSALESV